MATDVVTVSMGLLLEFNFYISSIDKWTGASRETSQCSYYKLLIQGN